MPAVGHKSKHEIKLEYFQIHGRAAPMRFVLDYCNVDYQNVYIEAPNWPQVKDNYHWGSLPVLTTDTGFKLA